MNAYVLGLQRVDRTAIAAVGGKGANLGELSRLEGIRVPNGFCVTTDAYRIALPELSIPAEVRDATTRRLVEHEAYAVRSSATAEDLPDASFAGQHDTHLNLVGSEAILTAISRCWASLFSERAIAYRLEHGFDARKVQMAVVVQKMIPAQAAGALFTADPVTGNRKVAAIEAVAGLGDTLVSGRVNPDRYQVREGRVVSARSERAVLTEAQVVRLAQLGRKIEAHFGEPQDIEWCLLDDELYIVQSRPITTLFPIPEAADRGNHVYVSVGHQQMMTDAMKPLGLSLWQLIDVRPMYAAGGRLFVDVTKQLASPASRDLMLNGFGGSDPLIKDALTTVIERGDFIETDEAKPPAPRPAASQPQVEDDPADVIARSQVSIEALKRDISTKSGTELVDFILEDVQRLKQSLTDPRSFAVLMAGFDAASWINEKMLAWLGEKNAADTLSQSVPNNVTSEMGLALLDVADVIRPHPEVAAHLEHAKDIEGLRALKGGPQAYEAMRAFLDKYGMRCAGEIDVTRPRWAEAPMTLFPLILANAKTFEPGAARRKFEQGRHQPRTKSRICSNA